MILQHVLPLSCVAVGGILAAALTHFVRGRSIKLDFVDRPGGHKGHDRPVAQGGGLALTSPATLPVLAAVVTAQLVARSAPSWIAIEIQRHLGGIQTKTPNALSIVGCVWLL